MREYCEYIVVDIETKYALVMGKKYKDFSEMYVNDTYRKYLFFGRKIREYYKLKTVGGRTCVIIYWAGDKAKNDIGSDVLSEGMNLRLRGCIYTNDKLNMRFLLSMLPLPLCEFE